ncbi:MAG: GerMN domain-containing protein [Patescibacteria group bacterium]|nr:GerMN domain-containing protein [Patescibacteria group bacterium]
MKFKFLIFVFIFLISLFLINITNQSKNNSVLIFYYNPNKDKDENGNIKCSKDGLIPIQRKIISNENLIKNTIDLLLKGKENLNQKEVESGLTTEFPLKGFKLKSFNLKPDGTLILEFDDPFNQSSGGSCRSFILKSQIEETLKQFSQIKNIEILPEHLFQP